LFPSLCSATRRRLLVGVLLSAGAGAFSVAERGSASPAAAVGGDVRVCQSLKGDTARACYRREVGLALAAISGTSAVPAEATRVTFASPAGTTPLLCDLHARVGVIDAQAPSWLGWTEPLPGTAPRT